LNIVDNHTLHYLKVTIYSHIQIMSSQNQYIVRGKLLFQGKDRLGLTKG